MEILKLGQFQFSVVLRRKLWKQFTSLNQVHLLLLNQLQTESAGPVKQEVQNLACTGVSCWVVVVGSHKGGGCAPVSLLRNGSLYTTFSLNILQVTVCFY